MKCWNSPKYARPSGKSASSCKADRPDVATMAGEYKMLCNIRLAGFGMSLAGRMS